MPKLPIKDHRDVGAKAEQNSISLLDWQWKRVDEIAKAAGYTRNELMREAMRGFINEWDADHATKRSSSK